MKKVIIIFLIILFLAVFIVASLLIYKEIKKNEPEVKNKVSQKEEVLLKEESEEWGRFAKSDEIIGFWELISLPEKAKEKLNKENPWPLPYQYFGIYNDGKMYSYMTSEKEENISASQLDKLFKTLPSGVSYKFNNGFIILTYPDMPPNYGELWGVNIILKDKNLGEILPLQKGDLLMSLDDGKGNPIYYRHLRKIE